jgi:phage tail sheath gpL-like
MATSIVLTGLASNDPVPGNYIEVNFAQGPASSGSSEYSVLLMGNKLSTGSATVDSVIYGPDTATPMTSEADAIALFGEGSELHRMVRRFLKINSSTSLYAIAVTESAGSQATGTVTFTTTATGNGTVRIFVGDEFVDASIVSGDTVTTVAASAKAAINSQKHWGVTADNVAGVLTITAKQAGLRGNLIRYSAKMLNSCGTTVTPGSSTLMTGGTTADSNTTALSTILPHRFYYIVPAAVDATQLGAVCTQVDTQAAPINGIRQRVVAGSQDTISNATTLAVALNQARAELVWLASSDVVAGELAAMAAACYSLFEAGSAPRLNFSGFGGDSQTQGFWQVKAPISGAAPTRTQIKSALNNGITPIGVAKAGRTYLVKRITTKSLTSSVADYRIRDAHKVTVCDRFADDLQARAAAQFSGKKIGNDPERGQKVPGPQVVTPRVLKAMISQLVSEYADNDLLENEATINANTIVVREASPTTRLSARVPLDVTDILDQTAMAVDQVG